MTKIIGLEQTSADDVLANTKYPVWLFTNEKIASFLLKVPSLSAGTIFGVGGAGDAVLGILAGNPENDVLVCDNRALALCTLEAKLALLRTLSRHDFSAFFENNSPDSIQKLSQVLQRHCSDFTRDVFRALIEKTQSSSVADLFQKKKYWYRESVQSDNDRIAYCVDDGIYTAIQKKVESVRAQYGDCATVLGQQENNSVALFYGSNIFDSAKYVPNPGALWKTLQQKVVAGGFILLSTQHNPSKTLPIAKTHGFVLREQEQHPFHLLQALKGHYQYSFLLLQKL